MKNVRLATAIAALSLAGSAFGQQIVVRPDGRADVVWLDANGYLNYFWAVPGSPWQYTGIANFQHVIGKNIATINEGLAAAIAVHPGGLFNSYGEADIAAVDISGNLYYYSSTELYLCSVFLPVPSSGCGPDQTVSWAGGQIAFVTVGGQGARSAPAIAVRSSGETDIVFQGPQNSLWHYHKTPSSNWAYDIIAEENTTYSAPAIAVLPSGEVAVAALGPNNSLICYISSTPSPTGPSTWISETVAEPGMIVTPTESIKTTSPAIAARSTGEVDVVWYGYGGTILYFSSNQPYSSWQTSVIAAEFVDDTGWYPSPLIAVRSADPAGEVDVVAGGLYYYATPGPLNPSPTWNSSILPSTFGPTDPIGLAVRASNPAGEADVISVDAYNLTLFYSWTSPPYSSWNSTIVLRDFSGVQNNP